MGILLLTSTLAHSEDSRTTVTVKVTVIAPASCVLNDGNAVNVDFGNDMVTKKVDGSNYKRPIPVNLVCTGVTNNAMKFQLKGTRASFGGTNILATNNPNLGIAIQILGLNVAVPLNSNVSFTYPNIVKLQAVPVKKPDSTLSSGKFSAGATLTVDYQ
ncbi:exported pilin protein [Yersinia intermedia]|jgi:type 1 fimbria pilin|nr:exported pilin protein [Yersinia intermedia]CNG59089.1 exported pilin protein [Yersinia intermedia]